MAEQRLADVAPEIHSFYKFPFLEQLPVREHFSIELWTYGTP